MNRWQKYLFPLLGVLGLGVGVVMVIIGLQKPPIPPLEFPPASSPFAHSVAGSGIIEALSENIEIGTPFNEIIEKVCVVAGDHVKEGDPLFVLNTQTEEARLKEALVRRDVAGVAFEEAKERFSFYERVSDPGAVSADDYTKSLYTLRLREQELAEAQAAAEVIETNIFRSTVRAPMEGVVLQVDVRPGQSAEKNPFDRKPLVMFGKLDEWQIRVSIDEDDAWRIQKGAPAEAFVRGNSSIQVPLEFVRIEPYIVPKLALTGDNVERVDTRVLQIIYRFKKDSYPVYVGQIMDVFIKALPANFRYNGRELPKD